MKLTRLRPPAERQAPGRAQRPATAAFALTALVALLALTLPLSAAGGTDTIPPSTPTGLAVSGVASSSLVLSWEASTDNRAVAEYHVFWLDGSGVDSSSVPPWPSGTLHTATTSTAITLTELTCGRTYLVGVSAADAAGNESGAGKALVSTAPCYDVSPPTPPSQLAQVGSTETSATLSWLASQDNFGVAGYRVYVGGLQVGQTPEVSYTFAGLACGTNTSVAVEAYDAAGNRSAKAPFVVTTRPCAGPVPPPPPPPPTPGDTIPPSVPGNLRVTAVTESSVTVAWSTSTDNVGVVGYGAYRGGVRDAETAQTSFTFSGLQCGTSTTVGIDAYDASLNRSAQASAIVSTSACTDTARPNHPGNVVRTGSTQTSISLRWSPAEDNVGVVGYGIYKNGVRVGQTSSTDYTLTGLACGTGYTIGVDAYDASGNRSLQSVALMTTSACGDGQAPTAPVGLTVSAIAQTSAVLAWTPSTDNVGIAGYDVFANGTKVGSTTLTTYTISGLVCGTAYTLGVDAFDAAGNRSSRSTKAITTAACAGVPSGGSVYVAPNGNDAGPCTATAPCVSFDRAYHVAAAGATVVVAAGTYPTQKITFDASKVSAEHVVFREAAGQEAFVSGDLLLGDMSGAEGPSHITIDGIDGNDGIGTRCYVDDVTIENVKWPVPVISGSSNVTIRNSEFGPAINRVFNITGGSDNCSGTATGIRIVNNWFHDSLVTSYAPGACDSPNGCHGECIQQDFGGTDRLTIEGNVLQNCQDFGILFNGGNTNLVVRNNFIDSAFARVTGQESAFCSPSCPRGGYSISLTDAGGANPNDNVVIEYNTMLDGVRIVGNAGVTIRGNIGVAFQCANAVYSYNAWSGTTCGPGDIDIPGAGMAAVASLVADGSPADGTMDLHLRAGSLAIDAGSPSGAPSSDIDGESRPKGKAPDAGADEAG